MFKLLIMVLCLALLAMINTTSCSIQTVDTSFGKIHLDVPNNYVFKDPNSKGNTFSLVKSGSEKPIICGVLDSTDIWGTDLVKYAADHFGEGKPYSEVQTNDGHRMLFYAYNNYGGDISYFNGIIDYTEDKGLIVMVFGRSETVVYGQPLVTFSKDEFLAICKSFAFE